MRVALPRLEQVPQEDTDFPRADCEITVGSANQVEAANTNTSVQVENLIGYLQRGSTPDDPRAVDQRSNPPQG